jgi:hypothetical protein
MKKLVWSPKYGIQLTLQPRFYYDFKRYGRFSPKRDWYYQELCSGKAVEPTHAKDRELVMEFNQALSLWLCDVGTSDPAEGALDLQFSPSLQEEDPAIVCRMRGPSIAEPGRLFLALRSLEERWYGGCKIGTTHKPAIYTQKDQKEAVAIAKFIDSIADFVDPLLQKEAAPKSAPSGLNKKAATMATFINVLRRNKPPLATVDGLTEAVCQDMEPLKFEYVHNLASLLNGNREEELTVYVQSMVRPCSWSLSLKT